LPTSFSFFFFLAKKKDTFKQEYRSFTPKIYREQPLRQLSA